MNSVGAVRNDEAQTAYSAGERLREMSADKARGRVSVLFAVNDPLIHGSEYR
jgi:hypothetical protein